jgi:hypothetical protein
MSDPILVVTDQGNRLNEAAAIALAQEHGVIDPAGQAVLGYSHALFNAVEFSEEQQREAAIAKHRIATELELVQHIENLMNAALAAGMKFTVTLDANGKMVPAALKA